MHFLKYCICTLAMLSGTVSMAQKDYAVASIPKELLSRASAVLREEQCDIEMRAADEVVTRYHKAVTILNSAGDAYASIYLHYNGGQSINGIKGEILDASGHSIQKITSKNFTDESAVNNYSLYEDSRVKYFTPSVTAYPYTILYDYERKSRQSLLIPDWEPNPRHNMAVQSSRYSFTFPLNTELLISAQNCPTARQESTGKNTKTYTWEIQNLKAERDESLSPPEDARSVKVKIRPVDFYFYKQKGTYRNWNDLGKWMFNNLVKPRQTPTASMISTVRQLSSENPNKQQLVRALYQYMQHKTRYISVQIGIGGFQPMPASDVDRLGYGDCKALVSYMQTLLDIAQIPSYYCVVEAGNTKQNMDAAYASMDQGNHIILAIPLEKDTMWLECTNPYIPAGFLGDFTDDRLTWASNADTSFLLRTPAYPSSDNKQSRTGNYTIDKEGNVSGDTKITYSGTDYDEHLYLTGIAESEQVKKIAGDFAIDIRVQKIRLQRFDTSDRPSLAETMNILLPKYSAPNGKYLYLQPNIFSLVSVPPDVPNRRLPLYLNRGYVREDSASFAIPDNYTAEQLPKAIHYRTAYGQYDCSYAMSGQQLRYYRRFVRNAGIFPPEAYAEYVQFMSRVADNDKNKIIFMEK